MVAPLPSGTEVALERTERRQHFYDTGEPFLGAVLLAMDLGDSLRGIPRTAEAKRAVKALRKQIQTARLHHALHHQLEWALREKLTNRIERPVLTDGQDTRNYSSLPAQGIDTLLEVTLQAVGLREHGHWGSRQFKLMLVARSRLIAAADASIIEQAESVHEGAVEEISHWLDDDSNAFAEALDAGVEDLAGKAVASILE